MKDEKSGSMETEVLLEIKDAEKKADEIAERAKKEKESIIREGIANSSKMIVSKEDEIMKLQEKKIADFREKSKLIWEEKIAEGKSTVKQLKSKSDKSSAKAADFILKKLEEMI